MSLKPILDAESTEIRMCEKTPPLGAQEAKIHAERCLYCFDAPCIMACPTGIDIPSFIKSIAKENVVGAARTILSSNILGRSCAMVCPVEELCEGACVVKDRDNDAVKIGRLQRFATDHIHNNNIEVIEKPNSLSGKKVAVIGSGPAGLSCAAELAKLGHSVTIYEKHSRPGGLNTHGIAYYKMKPEVSIEEIKMIEDLGVEIICNSEFGEDISFAELDSKYDAIFLGIGLGKTYKLGIQGEDKKGVCESLDFIEQIRNKELHEIGVGRSVAVIGCGNTAIDAVVQAKKLGAKNSTIIYRRGEEDMSAYEFEYKFAKDNGCHFIFNAMPLEILGEGEVTGIKLIKTETINGKAVAIEGSEFSLDADMVIKALGQEKQRDSIESFVDGVGLNKNGTIKTDINNGQTTNKKVFAGGDAVNGGAEVVNAVAGGAKAARGIHGYLTNAKADLPIQITRLGIKDTPPAGSGYNAPVRARELEEAYYQKNS